MAYTRDHGALALRYLMVRSKDGLTHYEKLHGALFFQENFSTFLQHGRECHRCACEAHVPYFSVLLAFRLYGGITSEPDDLFLWMCYIYVLYIMEQDVFDIGQAGYSRMQYYASELGVREEDMLIFYRELADDLWELRLEKLVGLPVRVKLAS